MILPPYCLTYHGGSSRILKIKEESKTISTTKNIIKTIQNKNVQRKEDILTINSTNTEYKVKKREEILLL